MIYRIIAGVLITGFSIGIPLQMLHLICSTTVIDELISDDRLTGIGIYICCYTIAYGCVAGAWLSAVIEQGVF